MSFVKKTKKLPMRFCLKSFFDFVFQTPPKNWIFLFCSAGIFCVFFIVFMKNVKSVNNYQRVFALTEKNEIEKIVKFYQRVFALTRFSIFLKKKNIQ